MINKWKESKTTINKIFKLCGPALVVMLIIQNLMKLVFHK